MGNDQEPRLIRLDTCEPWERVIPEGITRIGRSKANEIQLEDTAVSRFHCFLTREGPIVSIHPGKSKNPARLNGEAVNGQRLKSGQTLIVGRCQFVFEEPLAAPEPSPNAPRGRVAALRQDEAPPPGHSAAPCEPEAVLASRLPRRRPSRTPKLVGARLLVLGLCVALLPTTVWLMLSSNSAAPQKASDGTNDEVAARRRDEIAELERRLLELTRHEEEYKRALNEESAGKVAELSKHIAELKSALAEAKEQNEAPPPSPSTTLIVIPEPNKDDLELSSVASVESGSKPQRSSTTVVVPGPAGPVKRSPKELKALVAHLSRLLDDYATHTVFPETLEPELTELTSSPGKPAVEGILAVYYGQRVLRFLQDNGLVIITLVLALCLAGLAIYLLSSQILHSFLSRHFRKNFAWMIILLMLQGEVKPAILGLFQEEDINKLLKR